MEPVVRLVILILVTTQVTAVQKWYKCGELPLPPLYSVQDSQPPSNAKLRPEGGGEGEGGGWRGKVVAKGDELFCSCPNSSIGQGLVEVTITNGTNSASMSASIALICSDMIAQCHVTSTLALLVSPEARVKVLGEQASVNKLKLSKEVIGKGIARMGVTSMTPVTSRDSGECRHQHAQLEMHTNFKGHWNALNLPAVKQMIPFDVCSCVERLSTPDIPVQISLAWLSGPSLINKHHHLLPPPAAAATNSIHARPGDNIHSLGVTPASSLQGETLTSSLQAGERRTPASSLQAGTRKTPASSLQAGTRRTPASSLQAGTRRTPASSLQAGTRRMAREVGEPLYFRKQHFEVSVLENVANSTVVTTVQAVGGAIGGVAYSMDGNRNSIRLFSIESSTGIIRTAGVLNRETMSSHEFMVSAELVGEEEQRATATYTIRVQDYNDNTPTFLDLDCVYFDLTIAEDLEVGTELKTFSLVDEDSEQNAVLSYQLVNNTGEAFSVTPVTSGFIFAVAQILDYETLTDYHMTLIARDQGTPSLSSSVTIVIHIADVADNVPVFNETSYSATVREDTPTGDPILVVAAHSADQGELGGIRYSITVGGNTVGGNTVFHMDCVTGMLTLQNTLDYEVSIKHHLVVKAESALNSELSTYVSVTITVINVNDHAPIFSRGSIVVGVARNAEVGTYVTTVSADDADLESLGSVMYSLETVGEEFRVDGTSGAVFTHTVFTTERSYDISVVATDGGTTPLLARANVTIFVEVVGGARPVFMRTEYTMDIVESSSEEEGEGLREVIQVSASDNDSSQLHYFIQSGNHGNRFSIADDGKISAIAELDREVWPCYSLVVVVTDGRLEANTTVQINLIDINDHTPLFQRGVVMLTVPEDVLAGAELVTVTAEDLDSGNNSHVTYMFPQPHPLFVVDPESGVISLGEGQSLDYDLSAHSYNLTVVAEDGGSVPFSTSIQVLLTVQDLNDNAPVFDNTSFTVSVLENQPPFTPLLRVMATDADSAIHARIRYTLSGDLATMFALCEVTGSLYTRIALDRELRETYQLSITASDGIHNSTTSLSVTVMDEEDDTPIFTQTAYTVYIAEPRPSDSTLLEISATTRDTNATLQYGIVTGDSPALFSVDVTGVISPTTTLMPSIHEGVYIILLTVQHGCLSNEVPLSVIITTEDMVPRLQPLAVHLSVLPSLFPPAGVLGRVLTLQDSFPTSFSLHPSPPHLQRLFSVDDMSGVLSVTNRVYSGRYILNVSAAASGGVAYALATVQINVVSNATLDSAVVVTFPRVREEIFVALYLESFSTFVADLWTVSRDHVEVLGVQMTSDPSYEGVEVGVAVRSHDYHTYVSAGDLRAKLLAHATTFAPTLGVAADPCMSDTCPTLQRCHSSLHLHAHNTSHALRTLDVAELAFHGHQFSLGHRCECPEGYSRGSFCSVELDECDPSPCHFGAECIDYVGGYRCVCPLGTTGENCSIVCPSSTCSPCDPNPCLYGGECHISLVTPGGHTCTCPLAGHTGPNCELISASFTRNAYLALPVLSGGAGFSVTLSFASLVPSGLLLYAGRYDTPTADYISVELLVGQVVVGVSFGGVATVLVTDSAVWLNDGEWHVVDLVIRNRVVMVTVSNCFENQWYLVNESRSCDLEAILHSQDHRILDTTTPLYLGGLGPYMSSHALPVSSTSYEGCISNVVLNQHLVDLSTPLYELGTMVGCPPLEDRGCVSSCSSQDDECASEVWNGVLCTCDPMSTCQDGAVQLNSGYIRIQSGFFSVDSLLLSVRTRSPDTVLATFGNVAALILQHGSLVYVRRNITQAGSYFAAITIATHAYISDGLWHDIMLTLGDSLTKLSVDDGRVSSELPEGGMPLVTSIDLGVASADAGNSFTGCMRDLVFSNINIDLASESISNFDVTRVNVTSGCGSNEPCSSAQCPGNSVCTDIWQGHSCQCNQGYLPLDSQCVNPCMPNPCRNSAHCSLDQTVPTLFTCGCDGVLHSGPLCEVEGCGLGRFGSVSTSCQPCPCDPRGAKDSVCDGTMGSCFCEDGLQLFNETGGLSCQFCDCDTLGAESAVCEEGSGQCECRTNVIGRRCDQCQSGTAGMDEQGCRAATVVQASLTLPDVLYQQFHEDVTSPDTQVLISSLTSQLERELYLFALPGVIEVTISSLGTSCDVVEVFFNVASYMPRPSVDMPRPSVQDLAKVLQVILLSGRVGEHRVNSSVSAILVPCEVCDGCHGDLVLDGLFCRAPVSCDGGGDVDGDGFPDECDVCPYLFNPEQTSDPCAPQQGVCPGDLDEAILWSATSAGVSDVKPCPLPLLGFSTRFCADNASWDVVDLIGCISVEGQSLLEQVAALEDGRVFSLVELGHMASTLATFSRHDTPPHVGGDIRAAGKLLTQLIMQLDVLVLMSAEEIEGVGLVENITKAASNLLSPALASAWMGVVEGVEFDSGDFLFTMESLAWVVGRYHGNTAGERQLTQQNLLIVSSQQVQSHDLTEGSHDPFLLNGSIATVSLATDTPLSMVTFGLFPTLGGLLPLRSSVDNISQFIVATPILSVQTADVAGLESTQVAVTLTLQFSRPLLRPGLVGGAMCMSWGGEGGWTPGGCALLEAMSNASSATCECSHLTAFAVLLPQEAYQPLPVPVEHYRPSIFVYVVLSCVCVLYLVAFLLLLWVEPVQGLSSTVHRNLILSLLLTSLVMMVGVDRRELQIVCEVVGVVITMAMLVPLCWMLADLVVIARMLMEPSPKQSFALYLYVIGWVFPLLLCGISIGTSAVVKLSFSEVFSYPDFCWLALDVVWAYVVPAIFLIVLFIIPLTLALVTLKKMTQSELNVHKIRVALCVSMATVALFLLSMLAAILSLYVLVYLEYLFAVLHAILAVFLFTAHCLNDTVRAAILDKFKKTTPPKSSVVAQDIVFPLETMPLPPPPPSTLGLHRLSTKQAASGSAVITPGNQSNATDFNRQLAQLTHQPGLKEIQRYPSTDVGINQHHQRYPSTDMGIDQHQRYPSTDMGIDQHQRYPSTDVGIDQHQRYPSTDVGIDQHQRYPSTDVGIDQHQRYPSTDVGIDQHQRYPSTDVGIDQHQRYPSTDVGIDQHQRYPSTDVGIDQHQRYPSTDMNVDSLPAKQDLTRARDDLLPPPPKFTLTHTPPQVLPPQVLPPPPPMDNFLPQTAQQQPWFSGHTPPSHTHISSANSHTSQEEGADDDITHTPYYSDQLPQDKVPNEVTNEVPADQHYANYTTVARHWGVASQRGVASPEGSGCGSDGVEDSGVDSPNGIPCQQLGTDKEEGVALDPDSLWYRHEGEGLEEKKGEGLGNHTSSCDPLPYETATRPHPSTIHTPPMATRQSPIATRPLPPSLMATRQSPMATRPLPPFPVTTCPLPPVDPMATCPLPPSPVDPMATCPLPPVDSMATRPLPPVNPIATRPLPPSPVDPMATCPLPPSPVDSNWWTSASSSQLDTQYRFHPGSGRGLSHAQSVSQTATGKNPLYWRGQSSAGPRGSSTLPYRGSSRSGRGLTGSQYWQEKKKHLSESDQITKNSDGSETVESLV